MADRKHHRRHSARVEIRWTLEIAQIPQPLPATTDWPAVRDYRDPAVHELADSEALLRERLAALEADVEGYRMTLCRADGPQR